MSTEDPAVIVGQGDSRVIWPADDPFDTGGSTDDLAAESEAIAVEDDAIERERKALARRDEALEARKLALAKLMVSRGITSLKTANGLHPSVSTKQFYHCLSEHRDEMVAWVKASGHANAVTEQLRSPSMLKSICESVMEDGGTLPEFIKHSESPTISLRGKAEFLRTRSQ